MEMATVKKKASATITALLSAGRGKRARPISVTKLQVRFRVKQTNTSSFAVIPAYVELITVPRHRASGSNASARMAAMGGFLEFVGSRSADKVAP
jgi:hypothetical protein